MEANPPYITFEVRAIEKRLPATEGGTVYYEDVDYAIVTAHGGKDTVEKVVKDWFVYLKEQARQGRYPLKWVEAFNLSYKAWKEDKELPVIGTPIKNWPVASPAEIKRLTGLGLRAVEDIATANEELIGRLGMGGRSLCQRAKDWVAAKDGTGPLVQRLDALGQTNIGLEQRINDLMEANMKLAARLDAREAQVAASISSGQPVGDLEDRLAAARSAADATGLSDDAAIEDALA